jgi:hypothetical protein
MATVHLKRYVRHRHRKPPLALQARDCDIIRLVAAYRAISSDDIRLLVKGSDQGLLRRLQRLFHHGYLDRPRSQRTFGNVPMIYALGERGAALLAGSRNHLRGPAWSEKNRQIGAQYLDHLLLISRFRAAVAYACAQYSDAVEIERWENDGAIRDAVYVDGERGPERIPIVPDAYVVFRLLDAPGGRIHAFIEADRGTMTRDRYLTKLRGYFAYWRTGRVTERLGIKNFLVVTITTSEQRARGLAETCRKLGERGLRPFLFASETAYLPAERRSVLDAVWQTPADDRLHFILE